jgi:hypothetical protein
VPRAFDERANADLFFAELTGQPLRRSPRQGFRAGRAAGWVGPAEDAPVPPVRSAVLNPGKQLWVVMKSSQPAKEDPPNWAGAIRWKSDYFSDYTGWEYKSETFTIDKLTIDKPKVGISLDMLITANVKGKLKGADDAIYVMEATVKAFPPRDYSATRKKMGDVDVEVGYVDNRGKLQFAKASWDSSKGCARLDIPVRVTYSAKGLKPDEFTITWFGNGDPPLTPASPAD